MKTSSSRMKNKVGAQKGAFIKMKQENMYIYQWLDGLCYVPIILLKLPSAYQLFSPSDSSGKPSHISCNSLNILATWKPSHTE
ncbi:hypothetical protein EKN33_20090 [Enterobacter asburiae]|nr:hypothetical protein EKN33_20090 [Enterobacter asburiae]